MTETASSEFVALQRALAGRFSLEREIGRGGMGVVFLARDVALDRPVAIKLLPPDLVANAEARDRFLREARTAAQLSHPNIVPIHLVEERDGLVFFVMAFVDGESVGERVRRMGALPTGEVIRLVQEVAWALGYAHGRGVVHRDVKPDNVLIERASGRAMLADFGIARRSEGIAATTPGMILGSLQYMAPEQADAGMVVDGRADIYSLGVTAFYALTGRLPFEGDRPAALIAAHMLEPAPPISAVVPAAPAPLAEAIDRCLAKDPASRWQSGEALADGLADLRGTAWTMPPSIRVLATAMNGAIGQWMLLGVVAVWIPLLVEENAGTLLKMLAVVGVFPLITLWEGARAIAIAGYDAEDVVQAMIADRKSSDRYTEHVRREVNRSIRQITSPVSRAIIGVIGGLQLVTGVSIVAFGLDGKHRPWEIALSVAMSALMGWMGSEMVGHAFQIGPFKDRISRFVAYNQRRTEPLANAFWSSRLIRGLLAFGRLTSRGKTPAQPLKHRPTEVVLASAASDLFALLSESEREALAGVPQVVAGLEAHAMRLRTRRAALDGSIAAVGDPSAGEARGKVISDIRIARERVEEQLRSTVEALENLRLDLLRLQAGVGSTADLTEAIAAARRLGEEIDYTLAGRAESARVLSPDRAVLSPADEP